MSLHHHQISISIYVTLSWETVNGRDRSSLHLTGPVSMYMTDLEACATTSHSHFCCMDFYSAQQCFPSSKFIFCGSTVAEWLTLGGPFCVEFVSFHVSG